MIILLDKEIDLIKKLDRHYEDLTMLNSTSEYEVKEFNGVKNKLKKISDHFKNKYDADYGIFESEVSKGNPVNRAGNLRRVWAGIYKGSENKQYSAQISFVVNTYQNCLDVGFYFGRISSYRLSKEDKAKLENQLKEIGKLLYAEIKKDEVLKESYYSLFEYGFKAEIKGKRVSSEKWLANLNIDPSSSSIVFCVDPELGYIDLKTIDLYVSMVMPLMGVIPKSITDIIPKKMIKPLSPEQRARQAEQRALIGYEGERYIMEYEKNKLEGLNIQTSYLIHQSLISDNFGYDILSCDENLNKIYIEVKTTTRLKNEYLANEFYISVAEYDFYKNNKDQYKLYRVYDIYGNPEVEIVSIDNIEPQINGYKMVIPD